MQPVPRRLRHRLRRPRSRRPPDVAGAFATVSVVDTAPVFFEIPPRGVFCSAEFGVRHDRGASAFRRRASGSILPGWGARPPPVPRSGESQMASRGDRRARVARGRPCTGQIHAIPNHALAADATARWAGRRPARVSERRERRRFCTRAGVDCCSATLGWSLPGAGAPGESKGRRNPGRRASCVH